MLNVVRYVKSDCVFNKWIPSVIVWECVTCLDLYVDDYEIIEARENPGRIPAYFICYKLWRD